MPEGQQQGGVASRFAGQEPKFFVLGDKGINTQVARESIEDDQFSWLENLQPIGKGNRKALYDKGTSIYTAATGKTIIYDNFFNIGLNTYAAVFLSDGSAVQVNTATNAVVTIATANTFQPTSIPLGSPLPAACQSAQSITAVATGAAATGTQYLVIVAALQNGYWVWNGSTLYGAGGLSPVVTLTMAGQGYASLPTVTVSGGHGSGATFTVTIGNGQITTISVNNPGSGYQQGDTVTLVISGGLQQGSGAVATAAMATAAGGTGGSLTPVFNFVSNPNGTNSIYELTNITIATGGNGYSRFVISGFNSSPSGSYWGNLVPGGTPSISVTETGGVITNVVGTAPPGNPNYYYTTFASAPSFPTILIVDPGYFFVNTVSVSTGGSGYSPSVTCVATGGAAVSEATFTVNLTSGVVSSVTVQNAGIYTTATAPTLTFTDTQATAAGTVSLMPFGVSGTYVETYQNRIWVENGQTYSYSAPNNLFSFSGSLGGGTAVSNDAFLRRQITAAKQANGFLYLFGDSSVNVVSNVQSTGSPLTTTLNNQNVDPQEGTTWPNSVQAFGRGILFANATGVFALYGGAAEKISDDLDGIFEAGAATFATASSIMVPSAAAMTLNEQKCYMLLVPTSGPNDDGALVKRLAIYDGKKWFLGSQSTTLTFIATQEINSVLYAWGTDGTNLFPLFNTAGSISKVWQSKLWSDPFVLIKQALRLYTMGINNVATAYSLSATLDSLLANASLVNTAFTVTSNASTGPSLQYLGGSGISARGAYLGITVQTTAPDFTLVGQNLLYRDETPLGG